MDALVDLTTVEAASAHLARAGAAPLSAADVGALITAVSIFMQQYAARRFVLQPYTATLSGRGEARIFLPNTPLASVSAVMIDSEGIPAAGNGLAAGYVFDEVSVGLRGYCFKQGMMNVAIAYTGGFAHVPEDIAFCANEGVVNLVKSKDYEPNAVSLKAGDHEIRFASPLDMARVVLTPRIQAVLNEYRRLVPV